VLVWLLSVATPAMIVLILAYSAACCADATCAPAEAR
jgi:hypothetical protein